MIPSPRLATLRPYAPPANTAPIDLHLDANEGPGPSPAVQQAIADAASNPDTLRRYPDARPLEAALANTLGTTPAGVLVTNGGDDAIDRACRAVLDPGTKALLHTPTFEMIPRGITLAGAESIQIPWRRGDFPTRSFLDAIADDQDNSIRLIALVTPNNPTGGTIPTEDLLAIADAAPDSLILVDLAYIEFADEDPTPALLTRPNVLMIRTFSKARSLAGLRVGYAVAPEPIIDLLRTTGGPYPVSPLSLAAATAALADTESLEQTTARVRTERAELTALLTSLGASPIPSQANFITADFSNCIVRCATGGSPASATPPEEAQAQARALPTSESLRLALAEQGIAVRGWPTRPDLANLLRITLPANQAAFDRLTTALTDTLGEPR